MFKEKIKMFESQPFLSVYPIASFFLTLYGMSQMPSQLSLEIQEEADDLIAANIENLKTNGACSAVFTKWRIKKLKKLKKSLLGIC